MSRTESVLQMLRRPVFLALAPAVALAGCTEMKIKMGMTMSVATLPVNQMEVHLAKPQGVGPGQNASLVVTFTGPNGQTWRTEGAGGGVIMWEDLTIASTIATYNNDGTVSLPVDPRLSDGKTGHVVVTLAFNPNLRAEADVPTRYDLKYFADFNGSSRLTGNAPNVMLRLVMHPGDRRMIEAAVQSSEGKETFYLIDPNGGSLSVSADGSCTVRDCSDRSERLFGRGGAITVIYDPAVAPYLGVLQLSSLGGPEPVFISQRLDPLW